MPMFLSNSFYYYLFISNQTGTCGPVYAMERVQPYSDFFPQITPSMPWKRRVRIAKNFIHLLMEFEKSSVGRLVHCDVQEGNFGLTKDLNVKAIDVDLINSPDRMGEIIEQPECESDKDCDFFDCIGTCDTVKRKCTKKLTTNNLMVGNLGFYFIIYFIL